MAEVIISKEKIDYTIDLLITMVTDEIAEETGLDRKDVLTDFLCSKTGKALYDEVCKYFPFNPIDNIEDYRQKVEHWVSNYKNGSYFHWGIEWKETGELIGTINLGNVEEECQMSDTCYMLSPKFWNRGIMSEVLTSILDYAFDEIGLHRVQAEVFEGNDASSVGLKKCGMTFEGVARKKYYKKGKYIDAALWAIIAEDRVKSK